jgi:hypothetical protein
MPLPEITFYVTTFLGIAMSIIRAHVRSHSDAFPITAGAAV